MEWQPETFKWLKKNLHFTINCYGPDNVEFSENLGDSMDQCESLDHIMMAMSLREVKKPGSLIKKGKSDFPDVIDIYEEENYWHLGYNMRLIKNNTADKVFVMSHSNLDFENGLIIPPKEEDDDEMVVSRSQYCVYVMPGEFRGVYTKPYPKFKRGGQASTQKLIEVEDAEDKILQHYDAHHQRYQLAKYEVPHITEDLYDENKMPSDEQPAENEGMAPPVKSGFRPPPASSTKLEKSQKPKTFAEKAAEKTEMKKQK